MRFVYALLLSVLGLIGIIFNRFAVEQTMEIIPRFILPWPPIWFLRIVAILAGSFFVIFGILNMMGFLQ